MSRGLSLEGKPKQVVSRSLWSPLKPNCLLASFSRLCWLRKASRAASSSSELPSMQCAQRLKADGSENSQAEAQDLMSVDEADEGLLPLSLATQCDLTGLQARRSLSARRC